MKPSTYIPSLLLIYLAIMAYLGRFEYQAGHYLYYISIVAISLVCIISLHFFLKKHQHKRRK